MQNRIREIRKQKGITMKQLGLILGLAESTISQYETGKREPSIEQARKIADALSVSLSDLLGIEPEGNKESDKQLLARLLSEYAAEHSEESAEHLKDLIYFDENGLRFRDGGSFDRLVSLFDSLNEDGQWKAVERVEELTEIPKYQK